MKVVLINPPRPRVVDVVQSIPTFPRIGLASIAACLEEHGYSVSVIDPVIEQLKPEALARRVSLMAPDILGISAYTEEVIDAGRFAEKVKKALPQTLIVVGGAHASAIPQRTLEEFEAFDVAVVGEGEQILLELAEKVEEHEPINSVKGIWLKAGSRTKSTGQRELIRNLDILPFPAWHLFPLQKYRGYNPSGFKTSRDELELPVEGARGCPFNCVFCYRIHGRNIRFKSPKRIADEVERDIDEFGATRIEFVEGTFGTSRKNAVETCNELIARGLNKRMKWETGCRVDRVDLEVLTKMKEAGCFHVSFGVESGNAEILRKAGKMTTLEQIRKAFSETRKAGIRAEATFILGLPYETEATINQTIDFAKELDPETPNFAILVPFPGTEVARMAKEHEGRLRLLSEDWSKYGKQIGQSLELDGIDFRKLKKLQLKAYTTFYARPTKIWYVLRVMKNIVLKNYLRRWQWKLAKALGGK